MTKTPVMVMRNLNMDMCLQHSSNLGQVIAPLSSFLNAFHPKCPIEDNQPNDYLYKRMLKAIVEEYY